MEKSLHDTSNAEQTPANKKSGIAISSLILGVLGLITGIWGIGVLLGLSGLVLGIWALIKIGHADGSIGGKRIAIAGLCISCVVVLLSPFFIVRFLGAVRQATHTKIDLLQVDMIQLGLTMRAQHEDPNASGHRPFTADIGELIVGHYFTADWTQSPMDRIGDALPDDIFTWTIEDQAQWVRMHSDYVVIPGLVEDGDGETIAVFGKPDRFGGRGVPLAYNDNSTSWESDVEQVEQDLLA